MTIPTRDLIERSIVVTLALHGGEACVAHRDPIVCYKSLTLFD